MQLKQDYTRTANAEAIPLAAIPVLSYNRFFELASGLLHNADIHCVSYHAWHQPDDALYCLCVLADDHAHDLILLAHRITDPHTALPSLTAKHSPMQVYERELAENFGIRFTDHPWPKPIRYPHDRADQRQVINNYPFYAIESGELHEVGVGPIHAGVIEPGYFRFICLGEQVLHLEIQLGWQHRGIEHLFRQKTKLLQHATLAENIAGDTAVGHTWAWAAAVEALAGIRISGQLAIERAIALELERIAIHAGDLSGICTDVAYQLGSSVYGVLRTPLINFMQRWCGNRFAKSLIRVGGTHYPLTETLRGTLREVLNDYEWRFDEVSKVTFDLESVLSRLENIGTVTATQARLMGLVGMSARMAGIPRDIRHSHPTGIHKAVPYQPVICPGGDVYARAILRVQETMRSIAYIRSLLDLLDGDGSQTKPLSRYQDLRLAPDTIAVSLVEGWRGEICHTLVTDAAGHILHTKAKDPSFHNWMGLAIAVRNQEISDFPINNKSFNLSYCGHDL